MNITKHFKACEAIASQTAEKHNINNMPSYEQKSNIKVAACGMEQVRRILCGNPIFVSSWFRSPELNWKVGGAKNSSHMEGYAVDFVCSGFGSPRQVFNELRNSFLAYDQLILEYDKWVHISFDPKYRQESFEIS